MPNTALNHFNQDVARARAIVAHADPLPVATPAEQMLRSDLLRSAWMFAVGAMDAYFCDAYTDIVAATIISKSRHPAANLPDFFYDIRFPIRAILEPYANNENWRWRMAARKMMERENVLRLSTVQTLFNKFFRRGHRFFRDRMADWIVHPDAKKRLFGITRAAFIALAANQRRQAIEDGQNEMEERYSDLFQRRHDCIHNCDRPKVSPQALPLGGTVLKVIQDAEFLVQRCDEHINAEFREFLLGISCPPAIVAQAGY
ncbi:MAG: hypothetical protein ACLQNE_20410 [Thermoguttaceae bacterium]